MPGWRQKQGGQCDWTGLKLGRQEDRRLEGQSVILSEDCHPSLAVPGAFTVSRADITTSALHLPRTTLAGVWRKKQRSTGPASARQA